MSAQFINLPPEGGRRAPSGGADADRPALDLDRATFFRIAADGTLVDPVGWHARRRAADSRSDAGRAHLPVGPARRCRPATWSCFSTVDEIPNPIDRESYRRLGIRSAVTVPLAVAGRMVGAVGIQLVSPGARLAGRRIAHAPRVRHGVRQRAGPPRGRRGPARRPRRGGAAARSAAGGERLPAGRSPRPVGRRQRHRGEPGDSPAPSSWSSRWRPPIRRCCCSARPAPARSCSRRGSTI